MASKVWQRSRGRLILSGALTIASIVVSGALYSTSAHLLVNQISASLGVVGFIIFGLIFLHTLTNSLYLIMSNRRLGVGRAASIKFILRVIGYVVLLLGGLELIHVSVGKLLLGGAVVGIILGVAAQQALANFFASIILIIAHPFRVGEEVVLFSGALGGKYEGVVADIGLTHTKLKQADGKIVFMPNSTLLSGAAIIPIRNRKAR